MRNKFIIENGVVKSGKLTLITGICDFVQISLDELSNYKYPIIFGDIDLSGQNLTKLPDMSNVTLYGDFLCNNNPLKSLKGIPKLVNGKVNCACCNINSLRHMPKYIGDGFDCSHNNISSLKHICQDISGDINFAYNQLTDLSWCISECQGCFNVSYNRLVSLAGQLDYVQSTLDCSYNYLKNTDGMPRTIYGDLILLGNDLQPNTKLTGNVYGNIICDKKDTVQQHNVNKFNGLIGKIRGTFIPQRQL